MCIVVRCALRVVVGREFLLVVVRGCCVLLVDR